MGASKRIKGIAVLLLTLTIWCQCSLTLFNHTHVIDGKSLTHSHPYAGTSDNPHHSHTTVQFLTIALLSSLSAVVGIMAFVASLFPSVTAEYRLYRKHFITSYGANASALRGPPVLCRTLF